MLPFIVSSVDSFAFLYVVTCTRFTARCTVVQSAVLRLYFVHVSVTLMDQDHIGRKSWKLIARTHSPTPSLFVAQRPSTYSQGKFGGDERWDGKNGVLEHKSGNVYETRRHREKVTVESP